MRPIGKTKHHHEILKRIFGDLEIVDATHNIRVFASPVDNTGTVAFFGAYAYVDMSKETEARRLNRFSVPVATRRAIEILKSTGKSDPNGYLLRPPARTERLDVRQKIYREYRSSGKAAAAAETRRLFNTTKKEPNKSALTVIVFEAKRDFVLETKRQ